MFKRIGAFVNRLKQRPTPYYINPESSNDSPTESPKSVPAKMVDPRFKITNYGIFNMHQPLNKGILDALTEDEVTNLLSQWRNDLRASIQSLRVVKLFSVLQELNAVSPDIVGAQLPTGISSMSCVIDDKVIAEFKSREDSGLNLTFTRTHDSYNYMWKIDGVYDDKAVLRLSLLDDELYEYNIRDVTIGNVVPGRWLNSFSELYDSWPSKMTALINSEHYKTIQTTESQAISQTLSYFVTSSEKFKDFPYAKLSATDNSSDKMKIVNDYMCTYFKQHNPKLEELYYLLKELTCPMDIHIKEQLLDMLNIAHLDSKHDCLSFKLKDSDISCTLGQLCFELTTEYAFNMNTPLTATGNLSLRMDDPGNIMVSIIGGSSIDTILDLFENRLSKTCVLKENYDNTGKLIESRALAAQSYDLE